MPFFRNELSKNFRGPFYDDVIFEKIRGSFYDYIKWVIFLIARRTQIKAKDLKLMLVIFRDIVWEIKFWLEGPNQIKSSDLMEWNMRKILVIISSFYDHHRRRYRVITFFIPSPVDFYDSWGTFLGKFCCK